MNARSCLRMHPNSGLFTRKRIGRGISAVTICLVAGCASMHRQKNDFAASGVQTAAEEVDAESQDLDLTMRALHEMTDQPAADLRQPFHHFQVALARLTSAAQKTETTGKRMQERNAAYLRSWDQQIAAMDYQRVREVSQSRRTAVAARCDALNQRYEESQAVVGPMIVYLNDIERALRTDLTTDGIASLQDLVHNAEQNALKVQTALSNLTGELTDSSAKMASIRVQNSPTGR